MHALSTDKYFCVRAHSYNILHVSWLLYVSLIWIWNNICIYISMFMRSKFSIRSIVTLSTRAFHKSDLLKRLWPLRWLNFSIKRNLLHEFNCDRSRESATVDFLELRQKSRGKFRLVKMFVLSTSSGNLYSSRLPWWLEWVEWLLQERWWKNKNTKSNLLCWRTMSSFDWWYTTEKMRWGQWR